MYCMCISLVIPSWDGSVPSFLTKFPWAIYFPLLKTNGSILGKLIRERPYTTYSIYLYLNRPIIGCLITSQTLNITLNSDFCIYIWGSCSHISHNCNVPSDGSKKLFLEDTGPSTEEQHLLVCSQFTSYNPAWFQCLPWGIINSQYESMLGWTWRTV